MRKLRTSFAYNITHSDSLHRINPIQKDLIHDLRSVDLDVYTIDELVSTTNSYPEAIPVLIKHLYLMKDRLFLVGILRALTVKEARGIAFEPIYEMYLKNKDTKDHRAKYGMANALQYLAEKKDMPRIIELALKPDHGSTRVAFVDKIASSATKEITQYIKKILETLAKDKNIGIIYRAEKALKRKKFL